MDPQSLLIDRQGIDEQDLALIGQLMTALGRLRDAENRLSEASLRYMKLNRNDMRALQHLNAMSNRDERATPGDIANHLNISPARTTKLLDRLEDRNST